MAELRGKHDGAFNARVVLEAIRGQRTIAEIASGCGVHPNQITSWKKQLLEHLPDFFSGRNGRKERGYEQEREALLRKIGELEVEMDWLQKN